MAELDRLAPESSLGVDVILDYLDRIAAFLDKTTLIGGCGLPFRRFLARESIFVPLLEDERVAEHPGLTDGSSFVYRGRLSAPAVRAGHRAVELGRGALVGEFSLLGSNSLDTDLVAREPTLVMRVGLEAWRRGHRQFPDDMAVVTTRAIREHEQTCLARALRSSHAFGSLDDRVLEAIRGSLAVTVVASGEYLLRLADPGDSLYLVVNGRLEILIEGGEKPRVVAQIGPGDTVGEIGVILDMPRQASVRAVRDSTVARLRRPDMHALLERYPVVINRALTASLASHLVEKNGGRKLRTTPKTIAVVPCMRGDPHAEVAAQLARALADTGTVLVLDAASCEGMVDMMGVARTSIHDPRRVTLIHMLSEFEERHDYLVYVADPDLGNWTKCCLRQADQVLLVGGADRPHAVGSLEAALGEELGARKDAVHLVLVHPPGRASHPAGTIHWLAVRTVAAHHHLRLGNGEDAARLARVLTGRAVGLVLGGGGARGFAHVGVIRALQEANVPIDLIGGTSMGALIGAQCALHWDADTIIERTIRLCLAGDRITLPILSLFTGKTVYRSMTALFGEATIEDLWSNYFSISCNLSRACVKVHDRGRLRDAVLASNSPPGLLPPVVEGRDLFIDGAFLNNVPVDIMAGYNHCGTIIAVDVEPHEDLHIDHPYQGGLSGWELLLRQLNPFSKYPPVPNILDILTRLPSIGGLAQREKGRRGFADLYLQPPVGHFPIMAYRQGREIAEAGYTFGKEKIGLWLAKKGAI